MFGWGLAVVAVGITEFRKDPQIGAQGRHPSWYAGHLNRTWRSTVSRWVDFTP